VCFLNISAFVKIITGSALFMTNKPGPGYIFTWVLCILLWLSALYGIVGAMRIYKSKQTGIAPAILSSVFSISVLALITVLFLGGIVWSHSPLNAIVLIGPGIAIALSLQVIHEIRHNEDFRAQLR
jgi:hypothetical protein